MMSRSSTVPSPKSSLDAEYSGRRVTRSSPMAPQTRGADDRPWEWYYGQMYVYLDALGMRDDLRKLRVIHVAGTKGKGSTCSMVESVLRSCGYRTGLYTSPHLIDVRGERCHGAREAAGRRHGPA